jgi:hypothetical protein
MSDRRDPADDFMDPDYEPGEFDLVERRLRRALHQEAALMEPTDRLGDILAAAGSGDAGGTDDTRRNGPPRWLAPVAAAAAVAVIAGTLWVATSGDEQAAPPAAPSVTQPPAPTPSQSSPSPEPSPSPTTSPTTSPSPSSAPVAERALLPVYYVGPVGGQREVWRLYREFLRGEVPTTAGDEAKAKGALDLALDAQPFSNTDGYLQPWSGTTVEKVTVTPQRITVRLTNAGSPGVTDADIARVAVQQLVWTAQAAVGKGTIPVTFEIADGSPKLFGRLPASATYNRPGSREEYYRDLAPIWVTAPGRDAVLPAGKPVVVKGEATVFEANVSWQLRRGATQVTTGFATATAGAPGRGEYSFSLGTLPPGSYTIRVFEMSMEGGDKVNAERQVAFTVERP